MRGSGKVFETISFQSWTLCGTGRASRRTRASSVDFSSSRLQTESLFTPEFSFKVPYRISCFLRGRQRERTLEKPQAQVGTENNERRFRHRRWSAGRCSRRLSGLARANQGQRIWHDYFIFLSTMATARYGQSHQVPTTDYLTSVHNLQRDVEKRSSIFLY